MLLRDIRRELGLRRTTFLILCIHSKQYRNTVRDVKYNWKIFAFIYQYYITFIRDVDFTSFSVVLLVIGFGGNICCALSSILLMVPRLALYLSLSFLSIYLVLFSLPSISSGVFLLLLNKIITTKPLLFLLILQYITVQFHIPNVPLQYIPMFKQVTDAVPYQLSNHRRCRRAKQRFCCNVTTSNACTCYS